MVELYRIHIANVEICRGAASRPSGRGSPTRNLLAKFYSSRVNSIRYIGILTGMFCTIQCKQLYEVFQAIAEELYLVLVHQQTTGFVVLLLGEMILICGMFEQI